MEQTVRHLLASVGDQTRRLEVLPGRPHRPAQLAGRTETAAIVAESFEPVMKVTVVARQHGLSPQHLTGCRRRARGADHGWQ